MTDARMDTRGSVLATNQFLDGRTAIVTGAAQGIGRVISNFLANAGAQVVMADTDAEGMLESQCLFDPEKQRSAIIKTDVRDESQVKNLINQTIALFGQLDILVNNAGVYPTVDVVDTSTEEWDRVVDVNLKGTFLCAREAARIMIQQGDGGWIINTASAAGVNGRTGKAHYCASKAGVILFTKCLALELADYGILVNAVSPGLVETGPKMKKLSESPQEYKLHQEKLRKLVLRRACPPEDVAKGVLFLVSPDSSYITGHVLDVNGGATAGEIRRVDS